MRRRLLFSLFPLVVLACSDSTAPAERVVGTWRLQTVNGLALPFDLQEPGVDKLELTGEVLTLVASGTVTIVTDFRVTDGTDVYTESIPDEGTYTVDGSTISFTFPSDGSTFTATVNGNVMTLQDIGLTFVYHRD